MHRSDAIDHRDHTGDALVACHECDLLHRVEPLPAGGKALCTRCGAELYRHVANSLDRALALNLAALMLFILANAQPFLSLKLSGRIEENSLISGAIAFFQVGMGELGVLVLLTSVLFPALTVLGMLYILVPLKLGQRPPAMARVYRWVEAVSPWSLVGVFMLGVLVSVVKLLDLATVIPGVSLFALAALIVVATAAKSQFDRSLLWPVGSEAPAGPGAGATATERGLAACHTCGHLAPHDHHQGHGHDCPRCDTPLHPRLNNSLTRTWALMIAAAILFIPANLYPVMTVTRLGQGEPNTILSGVIHLIEGGMWPLALLVFFASIVVPMLKLIVLTLLLVTVQRGSDWRPRDRTLLYRATEVVGAWSMVDVFLVAVLTALVNLDALATIRPGIGVSFFAAVVVLTMFAAHSFDPRLIWDHAGAKEK